MDSEAFTLLNGEMAVSSRAEMDVILNIISMKNKDAAEKSDLNTQTADAAKTTMIIVIVFAVILSISFGLFISSIISKAIKKRKLILLAVSQGDLTQRLDIVRKDEIVCSQIIERNG
jgi:methyl-accepting chemotaxis protein